MGRDQFRGIRFFDAGFDVRLGDHLNGFLVKDKVVTWSDAEACLRDQALALFPDSKFAQDELRTAQLPRLDGSASWMWLGEYKRKLTAPSNRLLQVIRSL
jgi:hypothetical protein